MVSNSTDIGIKTDLGAVARLVLGLLVCGHAFLFLHAFVFPWLPAVLVVICYPLLVDRIGHGNDGRRSLVRSVVGVPVLAIAFEAALALTAAGLYATSLRASAAVAFSVVYPQSSVFFAFSAGLLYVVAGCSYLVVHALGSTILVRWEVPSIR